MILCKNCEIKYNLFNWIVFIYDINKEILVNFNFIFIINKYIKKMLIYLNFNLCFDNNVYYFELFCIVYVKIKCCKNVGDL